MHRGFWKSEIILTSYKEFSTTFLPYALGLIGSGCIEESRDKRCRRSRAVVSVMFVMSQSTIRLCNRETQPGGLWAKGFGER